MMRSDYENITMSLLHYGFTLERVQKGDDWCQVRIRVFGGAYAGRISFKSGRFSNIKIHAYLPISKWLNEQRWIADDGRRADTADDPVDENYQTKVNRWMRNTFDMSVVKDKQERGFRFLEESLELAQAVGVSHDEAMQLINYTYNRPVGEPEQEVGGVCVTLAALSTACNVSQDEAAVKELQRCWDRQEEIISKNEGRIGPVPGYFWANTDEMPREAMNYSNVELRMLGSMHEPSAKPIDPFLWNKLKHYCTEDVRIATSWEQQPRTRWQRLKDLYAEWWQSDDEDKEEPHLLDWLHTGVLSIVFILLITLVVKEMSS